MNIDFHTHGKLAKALPFDEEYPKWIFGECSKNPNLDAVCLTEHFNTTSFEEFYHYIYENSEKDGDCLIFQRARIFPGMEIDVKEEAHILVLGKFEDIIEINRKLENHKTKETFLPFDNLMKLLAGYELIIGAAHPFRGPGSIPKLSKSQLSHFDFIDLNGKDAALGGQENIDKVMEFALSINKPVLCGSDTHQALQYGINYSIFHEEFNTFKQLKEEIEKNNFKLEISDTIKEQVRQATMFKAALKKIHALGGNYTEVLN